MPATDRNTRILIRKRVPPMVDHVYMNVSEFCTFLADLHTAMKDPRYQTTYELYWLSQAHGHLQNLALSLNSDVIDKVLPIWRGKRVSSVSRVQLTESDIACLKATPASSPSTSKPTASSPRSPSKPASPPPDHSTSTGRRRKTSS